jgi:hypothetical protein
VLGLRPLIVIEWLEDKVSSGIVLIAAPLASVILTRLVDGLSVVHLIVAPVSVVDVIGGFCIVRVEVLTALSGVDVVPVRLRK